MINPKFRLITFFVAKDGEAEISQQKIRPRKDVLLIIGDWNANVGSQEIPEVTGEFGLGVQNEAGHRLIEFC